MIDEFKNGYTKYPNDMLEYLMRNEHTKREHVILNYIIRNGYGYHKDQSECDRNIARIAKFTGLDKSHINTTLRELVKKKTIEIEADKIRLIWTHELSIEAKTASEQARPKQPRVGAQTDSETPRPKWSDRRAKTASKYGQNSLDMPGNLLNDSDIQAPKEIVNKKENLIPPRNTTSKDRNDEINEIVAYLNKVSGLSFKPSTKITRSLINARLCEGYTTEDFKNVIDVKNKEWKGNIQMDMYIRPQTLFSPKFEGYLQQSAKATKSQSVFGFNNVDTGIKGYGL